MLNLGRNQLAGKLGVGRLRALKALIVNDNQITLVGGALGGGMASRCCAGQQAAGARAQCRSAPTLCQRQPAVEWYPSPHATRRPTAPVSGLDKCRELNTLVLSHNRVASLGSWASGLPKLEKLSLSYNALAELGPALK